MVARLELYNGLAPVKTASDYFWADRDGRRPFILHAETNLLSMFRRNEGHMIACTLLPCPSCARQIIARQIGTGQIRAGKVGTSEVNVCQICIRKVCSAKICIGAISSRVCIGKTGRPDRIGVVNGPGKNGIG